MDVRPLPSGEGEMRRRHVGDGVMQVIAALRGHLRRLLPDEGEDHRKIVGREGPQNILLAPHLSQVQAGRGDVFEPLEHSLAHQFAQLYEGRVVLQQMADHQPPVRALRHGAELLGLGDRQGKRLLDKDVLAGFEGAGCELGMERRGCSDRDTGDPVVAQYRIEFSDPRVVPFGERARRVAIGVADRGQGTKFSKVPNQVLAPISAADRRHPHRAPSPGRPSMRPLAILSPMLPQFG